MRKTSRMTCGLMALALVSGPALAGKKIEYSFGEIGYQRQDSDGIVQDGFGVNIWGAVHDYVHLRFGYKRGFVDELGGTKISAHGDEFSFGAGGNYSILDEVDLVVGAVAVYTELGRSGGQIDQGVKREEWGYRVDVGVRAKVHKTVELNGGYLRDDIDTGKNGGFIGAVVDVTKKLSATINGVLLDKDNEWRVFAGGRLNF